MWDVITNPPLSSKAALADFEYLKRLWDYSIGAP